MKAVTLIGAPTDVGASIRGASMGPDALRVADIAGALVRNGLQVRDLGNLSGPGNPWQAPVDGMRHLQEVLAWNEQVFETAYATLAAGHMPLLMGGDHCLAIGSVSAAARHCREQGKRLMVLWLDAHADANTGSSSPTGNIHGMPVACLCGDGPAPLTALSGATPAVLAQQIRQIGIRSVDAEEKLRLRELGLTVYDMRYIDENGMRATMEHALAGIDANTHLHVSFDVDFLDSQIAPGVGTPVRGGPTYREAHLALEMIEDTGALGSLDVLELNPARDVHNQTAELVVELLESLFGKSTL
ncbi:MULTISPECIES: arginase [unclassified Cupriavidus]|jgi:arginase|uniref:arginase n=1 Tax=unclassified Cupriavidus TaxID=2640874 RepID=UPI001BFFF1A2|nr:MULTISPECIES: arginase [unclassified Cupriavidus]MCA3182021.1 arginase [Cupriavidus sp.]MCA3188752.1 arginase [Cupriavidus sp.]MCA3198472.1 arginase [Cupriavidus sp.]MCA3201218.1 arginase [Cupriavidus sp.]MCA3210423.1 arginase [Cupriavidus sp.]